MDNLAPSLRFQMPGWTDRWPKEKLIEHYYKITPTSFDRGYRQRVRSSSDLVLPNFLQDRIFFFGEDWRRVSSERLDDGSINIHYDPTHPAYVDPEWPRYIGADLSSKGRRGNVIFTLALSPQGIRHVIDIRMGLWEAPQMARQIDAASQELDPQVIFVENNAYQMALIEIIKDMELSCADIVEGFRTGRNKLDPEIGLPSIDAQCAMGLWRVSVPHGEHEIVERIPNLHGCACGICTFIRDCRTYSIGDKATPDTVAAMFICKEASRMGGKWTAAGVGIVSTNLNKAVTAINNPRSSPHPFRVPVGKKLTAVENRRNTDNYGRPLSKGR